MQVDGQIEKLERIEYAQAFMRYETDVTDKEKQRMADLTERLKIWQKAMRRTRTGKNMRREQELTENTPDFSGIHVLMEDKAMSVMEAIANKAIAGTELANSEIN